ncbi:helix-turn-helix transcriptional regulator [Dactylosporangium sp. NPDC049140]|uniref:helix-turn-helix transcriptional regulator n=1 Tax=Dactylosporangium sp. NPDC049140 TaxID=3155647 RepID=UPI0033F50484
MHPSRPPARPTTAGIHAQNTAAARPVTLPVPTQPTLTAGPVAPAQPTVAARLAALSAPTRRMLQVASAIGPGFGVLDLARLMRCGTAHLLAGLDEALDSGLLVSVDDRLMFSHALVHAAVAESLCRPAAAALRAELATLLTTPPPLPTTGWEALTEQERQIAVLVGRALTNQQIATRIGRSRHTVNYHLRRIFHKLGIASRIELASLAKARR